MNQSNTFINKMMRCIDSTQRMRLAVLIVMMLCMAGLEVLCALLFLPLLSIIEDPETYSEHGWLMWIVDALGQKASTRSIIVTSCSTVLVGYLAKNAFNLFYQYYRAHFVRACQSLLAYKLLKRYITSDYVKYVQRSSADLIRNINQDVPKVFGQVLTPTLTALVEVIILMSILGLLLYKSFMITVIAMGIFGTLGTVLYKVSQRYTYSYGAKIRHLNGQMIKWTIQSLGSIKETRVMAKESYFLGRYDENMDIFTHYISRFAVVREIPRLGIEVLGIGTVLMMTLVLLGGQGENQETLPTLGLFAVASFRMLPSINRITASLTLLRFNRSALDGVIEDLDGDDTHEEVDLTVGAPLAFERDIVLNDLHFTYEANAPVLQGCTLTIKRGQNVAFVGASGAGKTTLMDIMLGLLTPDQGQVLVDGVDIHAHSRSWQQLVGYISQPVYMLNDTVRRNVAFGLMDDEIDDDLVWKALTNAQLLEVTESLSEGLDTPIGDAGVKLSGGQRQRLGIARVLYRNPEVLVFDEATSALDNETEVEINRSIEQASRHKTSIMIAHRLSTIRHCDVIFMLEHGRVLAQGTYDELFEHCEQFHRLATITEEASTTDSLTPLV